MDTECRLTPAKPSGCVCKQRFLKSLFLNRVCWPVTEALMEMRYIFHGRVGRKSEILFALVKS